MSTTPLAKHHIHLIHSKEMFHLGKTSSLRKEKPLERFYSQIITRIFSPEAKTRQINNKKTIKKDLSALSIDKASYKKVSSSLCDTRP